MTFVHKLAMFVINEHIDIMNENAAMKLKREGHRVINPAELDTLDLYLDKLEYKDLIIEILNLFVNYNQMLFTY